MARNSAFPRRSRQVPFLRQRRKIDGLARFWTVPTNFLQPKNFPIADTFVGRDGTALNPARWYTVAGTAVIASNTASFATDSGSGSEEYVGINPSLLSGQNGRWDIRVDMTIVDTASVNIIALNAVLGISGYTFLVFTDGSNFQLTGPADGGATGTTRALVANDILHHRIVRDSITGRLDWYYWVNNVAEPSTPEVSAFDTSQGVADEIWLGRIQQDGMATRYDNFSVTTPTGAFPAPIVMAATVPAPTTTGVTAGVTLSVSVPAPTVTGGSNTTPAAIARTVVTPAPTTTGGIAGSIVPRTIGLGWYDATTLAPKTSGSVILDSTGTGQSFTGDGSTLESVSWHIVQFNGNLQSGTLAVKIYAHTGTFGSLGKATGSALATSDSINAASALRTVNPNSNYATPTPFGFSGANRIVLTNGTRYVAILIPTSLVGDDVVQPTTLVASPGNSQTGVPPTNSAGVDDFPLIITGSDAAHAATLVPAPTASGGSNATPAAIALTVVTPAPTASGGSSPDGTATPTAIALTAVTSAPTTTGGSNTTPAAITLTVVTSAPTITGSANTTPTAITRTVVTTTPTASGNSNASPTAIALTAIVYDYVGYPVVSTAASASGNTAASITPLTVSGAAAGDLLLVSVGSGTISAPVGYTKLWEQLAVVGLPFTIWGRIADGTSADAFYSNTQNQAVYLMWRVTHHGVVTLASDIKVSTSAVTATNVFDPPSLDAGASDQWLWVAAAFYGSSSGGLFSTTPPSGYSGALRGNSGGSGIASNNIWAWKQSETQTEDPGTFSASTASANVVSGVAVTLAIKPISHAIASGSSNTTPAAVALTVVLSAPTITGTAVTTPTAITLTVVTSAPTASGDARAPPAAIALAATTPAPTATGGTGGTAFPTAIALTTVLGTATATGNATASPASISLSTTTTTPTGTGQANTTATAIALTAVTSAPTASGSSNTTPAAIALTTTLGTATATGEGVANPTAIALTVTTTTPTVTGTAVVFPTAIALTVVTPAPQATGSSAGAAAPAAIMLTVVTTTPTASGNASTTPAAITLAAVTEAPTVTTSTNGTAFPTTIALTTTVTTPTASGQGVASPATIARTVVLSAPTATGGTDAAASPTAITVAATVTTPTGTGTANTTPAAIALTVTAPAPQATGASAGTAAPATIMLTAVVGAVVTSGGGTATPPTTGLAAATDAPNATGTVVYFPYWGARVG